MHTSHFHLFLTTALSICLGYTLSSSTAIGYPAGAVVSTGTNPIRSAAGSMDLATTATNYDVLSAPLAHDLIITDVIAGLNQNSDYCDGNGVMRIQTSSGEVYAQVPVYMGHMDNTVPGVTTVQTVSGLRIPAGTALNVQWEWFSRQCGESSYKLRYNISGYLSQP